MDDPALQAQLRRLRYRQDVIVALLVVPYLYLFAEYVGFALAGVLYAIAGVLGFGAVAYRRRNRSAAGT